MTDRRIDHPDNVVEPWSGGEGRDRIREAAERRLREIRGETAPRRREHDPR